MFLVAIIIANASDYIYYTVYKIYYNPSLIPRVEIKLLQQHKDINKVRKIEKIQNIKK